MQYRQVTPEERYAIAALVRQGCSRRAIARDLGRAPSTVSRELARNRDADGLYRAGRAARLAAERRRRAARNERLTAADWALVEQHLRLDWSPEQIAGRLRRGGLLRISHETIYLHVWHDKHAGGELWRHLRQAQKQKRKRYGARDGRGRVAGKRHISERPAAAEERREIGHWELDTMIGQKRGGQAVLTLVERASGYLEVGKLRRRTAAETNACLIALGARHAGHIATVTADNGAEFHSYREVEAALGAAFYFATPHHAWERGTSENTNGLLRQYLPKGVSMTQLTQADCDALAAKLNARPRKRLDYATPEERYGCTE
jgi:transposase, IS30 family